MSAKKIAAKKPAAKKTTAGAKKTAAKKPAAKKTTTSKGLSYELLGGETGGQRPTRPSKKT